MISKILNLSKVLLIGVAAFAVQSCNDNDDPSTGMGEVEFEITDAPSDDATVKGVFVTVTDIQVDGTSVGLAQKQTIDLTAYTEGQTKLLGTSQLDAKSYNTITLVLDNESDANGNAPGNYVLTSDDTKYKLTGATTGTTEIVMNKSLDVAANSSNTIVMDFDLRKAIQRSSNSSVKYQFVNSNDLNLAVRVINKSNAGEIKGTYQESFSTNADKIIVYAYKKGEFNQSAETTSDANGRLFTNAVTSTVVKGGLTDSYELHFLEEGEYEIAFAAHDKNDVNNEYELNTMLDAEININGSVANFITVGANSSTSITANITGLL
ncbi:MAG: DUF4382 domain-containing protein [Cyclobacteriaceae bacterium]